jgi:hypothetical protein
MRFSRVCSVVGRALAGTSLPMVGIQPHIRGMTDPWSVFRAPRKTRPFLVSRAVQCRHTGNVQRSQVVGRALAGTSLPMVGIQPHIRAFPACWFLIVTDMDSGVGSQRQQRDQE